MVDITHECGCEAMMFLGDHWIGTEPFMPSSRTIGLDAVVGSVGNGSTLRWISDIEGVKYTEGRFLPYSSPTPSTRGATPSARLRRTGSPPAGHPGASPSTASAMRLPQTALQFPDFIDYVESVCDEFRELYDNIKGTRPIASSGWQS